MFGLPATPSHTCSKPPNPNHHPRAGGVRTPSIPLFSAPSPHCLPIAREKPGVWAPPSSSPTFPTSSCLLCPQLPGPCAPVTTQGAPQTATPTLGGTYHEMPEARRHPVCLSPGVCIQCLAAPSAPSILVPPSLPKEGGGEGGTNNLACTLPVIAQ